MPIFRSFRVFSFVFLLIGLGHLAEAGPVDWLRSLGRHHSRPHHARGNSAGTGRDRKSKDDAPASVPPPSPKSVLSSTPSPFAQERPSVTPSIPAAAASPSPAPKTDLPFGVPVKDKPGFVVSPYSPNGGYVDVRGLPSGIEVKDPYTGNVFRTP